MRKVINSLKQLELELEPFREGYLFRGQVKHYPDESGNTNIPTSFSRHGCIPPIMFKWTHYAKAMIRAFSGANYFDIDFEISQAILQHYGWRSFYVDLTKSPQIAAWFASNVFEEKKSIHMCEDLDENPVWLVHKTAKYTESSSTGHIYVIDLLALSTLGIKVHDLTLLQGDEGKLRFHAQQACLVGNLDHNLPYETIAAHFEVPAKILREFYQDSGISELSDVFPPKNEDFILSYLLNLPWESIPVDSPIPAFKRGLELPDYEAKLVKHLPPNIALYSDFWLSDNRGEEDNPFKNIIFYKMSQFVYYANTNERFELGRVTELLQSEGEFVIELDSLIKVIENHDVYEYEKGIHVRMDDDGYIWVSGLVIEHPCNVVSGVGVNQGWCYKVEGVNWNSVKHPQLCPCNNDLRHQLHFSMLRHLNESLETDNFKIENPLCYRDKDCSVR
ncbi:FRG domain-containing protein [Vibrio parahaemolyticus]|uniref:FRG domain-containing protein n=1 Tax=Vibrio parahaemolyticus TaxID=670 RepID=UPI000408ABAB|nr:FRG domain-containing protein [Vibrio parahaemolyticus]